MSVKRNNLAAVIFFVVLIAVSLYMIFSAPTPHHARYYRDCQLIRSMELTIQDGQGRIGQTEVSREVVAGLKEIRLQAIMTYNGRLRASETSQKLDGRKATKCIS